MRKLRSGAVGVCALVLLTACQSSAPTRDESAATVESTASGEAGASVPVRERASERASERGPSADMTEQNGATLPDEASATVQIGAKRLRVDGVEVLRLDDGLFEREAFADRRSFFVDKLAEALDDALVSHRRQRVVAGKPVGAPRVAVELEANIPADTLLAVEHTASTLGVAWLSVRVGEAGTVLLRLDTDDFVGKRRHRMRHRRPPEPAQGDNHTAETRGGTGQKVEQKALIGSIGRGGKESNALRNIFGHSGASSHSNRIHGLGLQGSSSRGGSGSKKESTGEDTSQVEAEPYAALLARLDLSRRAYCDARADEDPKHPKLTHIAVELDPRFIRVRLVSRTGSGLDVTPRHSPTLAERAANIDAYPWRWLYEELVDIRAHYPEATTVLIAPHPSMSSAFVERAARANCRLSKASYASPEAYTKAVKSREDCDRLFDELRLSNGRYPTPVQGGGR